MSGNRTATSGMTARVVGTATGRATLDEHRPESFTVDGHTASVLIELRKAFGVTSNAEVIRKALALADIASQQVGSDHTITISSDDGKPAVKVSLVE
jgi:hypothetical protein